MFSLPLTARARELIVEYSLAEPELTDRLRIEPETGKPQTFQFTLAELDELAGFIAAEANHANKKMQKEWDALHDEITTVLDHRK